MRNVAKVEPSPTPRTSRLAPLQTRLTGEASGLRAASSGMLCRCFARAIVSACDPRAVLSVGVERWPVRLGRLKEKLAKLGSETQKLEAYEKQMLASPDQQISL